MGSWGTKIFVLLLFYMLLFIVLVENFNMKILLFIAGFKITFFFFRFGPMCGLYAIWQFINVFIEIIKYFHMFFYFILLFSIIMFYLLLIL